MIIFPAVDLQGGQAVRLRQGKAEESTVFSPDPGCRRAALAKRRGTMAASC